VESQSPKDITDYYKHLSLFWTDIIHLMASKPQALTSMGPMRAFASNSKKISTELIQINESLMEFNKFVTEYYKQLSETWSEAQKKVNLKAPDVPHDVEQMESFKRIWIDIFDNDFTELFDSEKFGENYGKLVSKELELTKHWNNISNVILQSVNLPSKEEIDEVYKEIHSLKKRVTKLEIELKKKKETKNEGSVKNEK
jgi:polyhydroxyalkanoate synthesis regulator phasin